jgi:hypothetical protein
MISAPHAPARTQSPRARAAARRTRPTYAAHQRRQAQPPRTHAAAQTPAVHPCSTRAPRTQERPEHTRPRMHPVRPRHSILYSVLFIGSRGMDGERELLPLRDCFNVTVSSTGAINRFKEMTTATSGVLARFPLPRLLPVRNSFASYGASAVCVCVCRHSYFCERDDVVYWYLIQ